MSMKDKKSNILWSPGDAYYINLVPFVAKHHFSPFTKIFHLFLKHYLYSLQLYNFAVPIEKNNTPKLLHCSYNELITKKDARFSHFKQKGIRTISYFYLNQLSKQFLICIIFTALFNS